MFETIIGIVGAIIGSLITLFVGEHLRKKHRMEEYAKDVFSSRMKIYEDLLQKVYNIRKVEMEISKNKEMPLEDKAAIWGEVVVTMARYFDDNENKPIQVTEDINVHVMAMLFGYYSVFETEDIDEQEKIKNKFTADILAAIDMIRSEGGFAEIENHFEQVLKPKRRSEYIEAIKKLRKEYSKNK